MSFVGIKRGAVVAGARAAMLLGIATLVAGCEDGQKFNLFQKKDNTETAGVAPKPSGKVVERDVESPEVFQVTEAGLWDGRPSLGGVWVAHPDVKEPERVIIRNTANSKFVVGALFRRERENPGPRLQVSSDAAETLGMLAGQPMNLNVTALRREEVVQDPPQGEDITAELGKPADIEAEPLDPVAGGAAAAIAAAEAKPEAIPAAAPAPKPQASNLSKPFIQIGIFSVEKNANNTATAMRQTGMIPTVKKQTLKGKTFWRVLVGPANTSAERAALLKKIKASGFTDAYFVTN